VQVKVRQANGEITYQHPWDRFFVYPVRWCRAVNGDVVWFVHPESHDDADRLREELCQVGPRPMNTV